MDFEVFDQARIQDNTFCVCGLVLIPQKRGFRRLKILTSKIMVQDSNYKTIANILTNKSWK